MKSFLTKPVLFWIVWGLDAVVALGFGFFFLVGLGDGTVSSFNIVLWLSILGSLTAILTVPFWLKHLGFPVVALLVLLLVGIPALLALLFFLMILISQPRWN